MSKEIVFITSNKNKVREAENLVNPLGFKLIQKNLEYPEIQTNSLEDVVICGVEYLKNSVDIFFLEDSGLFIQDLNNFPGVYSKFVFETIGNEGILKLMEKTENRSATFRTIIGFYDGEAKIFKGECKGRIAKGTKGEHGFGYDPVFIPHEDVKTFGEMNTCEKNQYSHRGKALKSFLQYLKQR